MHGPGGRLEHDALSAWWRSPREVLGLVAGPEPVEAVAVSAMMPSAAVVGASGRPVGPGLLYSDRRAFVGGVQGEPGPSVGSSPKAATAGAQMAALTSWLADASPRAHGYWPAQAVANAALCGRGVVDLASAFAAGAMFDGSGWDEAACRQGGFGTEQMPDVVLFGEPVGQVGPGILPGDGDAEVLLGAGSVDGFCELLVAGATSSGDVMVTLGSSLVVWLCVPGWPSDVAGLWRAPHLFPGRALVGGASNAGGLWVDWVDSVLRPGPADGSAGLLAPRDVPLWWPWANGERTPWQDPSLAISFGGGQLHHGPEALRRAALEASAFVVRHIVELATATGTSPQRFIVGGGGSSNPEWLQALADVLGMPVVPSATPDGAAIGAAYLARMAAGLETSINDAPRWARWSSPVEPSQAWVGPTAERYALWAEALPEMAGKDDSGAWPQGPSGGIEA